MTDQCGPWTLDQLDAFGSIDDLLVTLDSPVYESANTCILESSGSVQGEGYLVASGLAGKGVTGEANIVGLGSLIGTSTRTRTFQAAILGAGNLNASGAFEIQSGAEIQGVGTLTADALRQFEVVVSLFGVGELSATPNAEFGSPAEFVGIGNLQALGGTIINGSGGIEVTGSLVSNGYIYGEEWSQVTDESNAWTPVPSESNVWSLIPSRSNQWQSRG